MLKNWLKRLTGTNEPPATGFIQTLTGIPVSQFSNYQDYLKAACQKVWAAWRAIDIIANSVCNTPYTLTAKGSTKPVTDKLLTQMLVWPNEYETMAELLYRTIMHLRITGNAFWYKAQANQKGDKPLMLFSLNPKRVKVVPNVPYGVKGYLFRVEGGYDIPFSVDEIIHFKRPHPDNEYYGLGDIEVGASLFNDAVNRQTWAEAFWKNGASPSGILINSEPPTNDPSLWDKLQEKWQAKYGGTRNSGKIAWLGGKWTYTQIGLTATDMQDIEKSKFSIEQIFQLHGVPLSVAGIREAANYACLPEDQMVFTPNGPTKIIDLKTGDPIWQFTEKGLTTNLVDAIIPQGKAKCIKISTRTRSLEASDNHPFLTIQFTKGKPRGRSTARALAEYIWKRADELKRGDWIVRLEECVEGGESGWNGRELSVEFMELAGLFTGDGDCTDGKTIRWSVHSNDCGAQEVYSEKAGRVFSGMRNGHYLERIGQVKVMRHRTHFAVNSVVFGKIYQEMGLKGDSRAKQIPSWIFRLKRELKLAYLRGLLDSDGTVDVHRGQIAYAWANKNLAAQARALCIDCGVPVSNLRVYRGIGNFGPIELWRFTCGYKEFNLSIGSNHPKKLARLKAGGSKGNNTGRFQHAYPFTTQSGAIVFRLPHGFGAEQIISIEETGDKKVYDLATFGSHTFIAEGIVVHNTADIDNQRFKEYTILPLVRLLQDTINTDLVEGFNPNWQLAFNVSGLINFGKVMTDCAPAFDRGALTINELRERLGLPRDDANPLWNLSYIQSSLVPLDLSGINASAPAVDQAAQRTVDRAQ